MPTLVVAALLVGAGIYLLRTPPQDDYVSFRGSSQPAAAAPAAPQPASGAPVPAPAPAQTMVDIDQIFAVSEQKDAVQEALKEEFGDEAQQPDKSQAEGISSVS